MSAALLDRLPIIVGVGEITQRTKVLSQALEPVALMVQALRAGERDAGVALADQVDSIDIVCEYSWPYAEPEALLCRALDARPARCVYGVVGGESPVRFLHEAALRIWQGQAQVAAVVGAEAQYAATAAEQRGEVPPHWHPRDLQAKIVRGGNFQHPMAIALGANAPINVYPFYENATAQAWGMTPAQGMAEGARIWSRFSQVAAANPHAWRAQVFTPSEVSTPTDENRMISWPYPKRMVANPLVNMGAAVWLTSVGKARELGIPPSQWLYVWGGAKANEPRDYLRRSNYVRSHAQEQVLRRAVEIAQVQQVGNTAPNWVARELYSCFPVVPKMARRVLGLAEDAELTVTGGLSFFGAPLNNYMTHAAAAMARVLRAGPADGVGLLYGQGEYVTKHHAIVVSRQAPAQAPVPAGDEVQAEADRLHGPVPALVERHEGPATLETFTVLHDRGVVRHGVVIARTPAGERLMAKVPAGDARTLRRLMDAGRSPIGETGQVHSPADGPMIWQLAD